MHSIPNFRFSHIDGTETNSAGSDEILRYVASRPGPHFLLKKGISQCSIKTATAIIIIVAITRR